MKNVTAIILGGGRGTRLFPLTLERSKPAVGFAGKYRLIDIPINNCILGIRSRVGEGSVLKDVIMQGNDFYDGEQSLFDQEQNKGPLLGVGKNCRIQRCIIDKNARIGDNVVIEPKPDVTEYEGKLQWIHDGITVIPKGTVIPSGTVL